MAKILMIDDDIESIEDIRNILNSNHDVEIADNIDDAIAQLSKNAYDLLFLDLYMPHSKRYAAEEAKLGRETGYLLLKEVRSASSGFQTKNNVPVIVLTFIRLNMDPALKEKVMKEEPVQILEKPESLIEILQCVKLMLMKPN